MKNHLSKILLLALLICQSTWICQAQQEAPNVRHGNRQYNKEQYSEAEVDYRRGLDKNHKSFEAQYNLGNALFKQEKYADAIEIYEKALL